MSSNFKIIKLAEANVGNLHDLRISKAFFKQDTKTMKEKIINWTSLKVRTSVSITKIKRVQMQAIDGGTVFVASIANEGLLSRVCKISNLKTACFFFRK